MTQMTQETYPALREQLEKHGQGHVLRFWEELDDAQREALIADLNSININALPNLSRIALGGEESPVDLSGLEPVSRVSKEDLSGKIAARGRELLETGKVAAFTVAGGQGTRLGFDGPKGAFRISPVKNKSLFQLFAESIRATDRLHGCNTQWYIMTSPANDAETRAYFADNKYFGINEENVTFFMQGVMPAFDASGKILLDQKHRLSLAPDGHGGSLLALARTGMLADMAARGIDYISYFQVDNPLVYCLDPLFVGLHAANGSEMSSKSLPKADDLEKVGNFALLDGRQVVIEYSDLPDELAHAKNRDGSRKFDAGNIAIHMLSRSFVERLTADAASFALPWHRAKKKVSYISLETGDRIQPAEPNAIKLESFVFDALPLAEKPSLLETSRDEEFSPVKNATGVDSVETAQRAISARAAKWLESAGFEIPWKAPGVADASIEICSLMALDAEHFAALGLPPRKIEKGESLYIG